MSAAESRYGIAVDPDFSGEAPRLILVWAEGLPGCPSREGPSPYLAELLERVRSRGEAFLSPERKAAVRSMLRFGSYKPAGRAKPSSEYLLAAALDGSFPFVNGPVDANNAVSLEWGYPASVFDAAFTGPELLVRRGLAGESYVFNRSGQTIDLADLLLVCRRAPGPGQGWEPCGNPVKDAMATKVFEACRAAVAVVYAPASEPRANLGACAERFASLLREDCGAAEVGYRIL
jgi:DNA/RNA-binding domain of Phe-tRNA-synthetase-like protein